MKILTLIFLLFSVNFTFAARECEVYGISDSPQKLKCSFQKLSLALTCDNGTYFLDSSPVKVAYHLEVEYGPVPLVFEASDMELTVTIKQPRITAELVSSGKVYTGTCR